jgi:hypothetical protein
LIQCDEIGIIFLHIIDNLRTCVTLKIFGFDLNVINVGSLVNRHPKFFDDPVHFSHSLCVEGHDTLPHSLQVSLEIFQDLFIHLQDKI